MHDSIAVIVVFGFYHLINFIMHNVHISVRLSPFAMHSHFGSFEELVDHPSSPQLDIHQIPAFPFSILY